MIEDVKYLCNWVCESEYTSYQKWIETSDSEGHIYPLAQRIREYFDPPVDDIHYQD